MELVWLRNRYGYNIFHAQETSASENVAMKGICVEHFGLKGL
jgi:hypothetical protein